MSARALLGASAYLGAQDAAALVGRWPQQLTTRDHRGGYQQPYQNPRAPAYQAPAYQPQYQAYQPQYPQYPQYQEQPEYHRHQAWGGPTLPKHHHREWRRREWERRHPGIPFVGVEALMGADAEGGLAGLQPRAWLRDMEPPTMANRQVLPMNTGTTPVPIASTAQITSRPQRVAFRPERIFVSSNDIGGGGSAANWIINDITIGNRSQFAQSGALPGDMFSNVSIDSFVTFETAQTAMDVVMIVTYQGATEGGTPFYGSIIGTAAV